MLDRQFFELLSSTLWLPFGSCFILTLFLPFPFFLFLWGIVSVGFFCSLSLVACTGLLGRLFLTTLCTIRWWFCRTNSSQLESQKRVRVGGWGTGDMQSSCAASWRQMFVLPSLLGRRRQSWRGCVFVSRRAQYLRWEEERSCALSPSTSFCSFALPPFNAFLAFSFRSGAPGTPILPVATYLLSVL